MKDYLNRQINGKKKNNVLPVSKQDKFRESYTFMSSQISPNQVKNYERKNPKLVSFAAVQELSPTKSGK
jgi:hypothetical protein